MSPAEPTTAETQGRSPKPLPPTATPEVWMRGRWHWHEFPENLGIPPQWSYILHGNHNSREAAEKQSKPGDTLIRVPATP